MTITKRNGKVEALSKKKISDSLIKANNSVKDEDRLTQKQINRISDSVIEYCENLEEPIDIDVLEDVIEQKIMASGGYEVAKQYITYRYEKERIRQNKSLTEKLTASNVQNQNANVDEFSFGGRMGETTSFVTKHYALEHLISSKAKHNHNNNEIYIHDLDSYAVGMHNCLSIPFDKLLKNGFSTRQCDIRPAGSINTALQLVAVLFQIQSLQQFGGVAATHLDWTMVPYVRLSFHKHYFSGLRFIDLMSDSKIRKEHSSTTPLTKDEIKELSIDSDWYNHSLPAYEYAMEKTIEELNQAVEGMYHNLNTLQSRSGNQLPFSSINYGTCTLPEGQMVIKALLNGSINGVGPLHKTPIFPCGIFQVADGINKKPGDPNYGLFKLALKSTSLRLYPNYANIDWSGNEGYDPQNPNTFFSTMGCVKGDSYITMIINNEIFENISFYEAWNVLSEIYEVRSQKELGYDNGHFINLRNVKILDKDGFVNCNRIIRNPDNSNWMEFETSNHKLICTMDHPMTLANGKNVIAKNLRIGDELIVFDEEGEEYNCKIASINWLGWIGEDSYDVSTSSEHFIVNDIWSHNCRTANGFDINADDPKLVQLKDGRGNICPVTIIMPTLAMQAKEKSEKNRTDIVEEFMKLLDKKINEAKDMLIERFDWICSQPAKSAKFMYENGTMYGYKPEEGIRSALKHGTLALGQLGLAETLQILIGCDHTTEKGMELAIKIETLFKTKCAKFKKDNKLNFGVYYTPAENLCYTAMKKFKEKYGEIKNVSDKDYFTNSMHIPVWHKLTPFEKIDLESKLTGFSNAGCITYVELDSSTKNNVEALEKLVTYAMDKDIPYFAINVPNDTCECGYTGDIPDVCPKCGSSNIQRLRRVTGYLTGDYKTAFNYGKQKETENRVKHTGIEA